MSRNLKAGTFQQKPLGGEKKVVHRLVAIPMEFFDLLPPELKAQAYGIHMVKDKNNNHPVSVEHNASLTGAMRNSSDEVKQKKREIKQAGMFTKPAPLEPIRMPSTTKQPSSTDYEYDTEEPSEETPEESPHEDLYPEIRRLAPTDKHQVIGVLHNAKGTLPPDTHPITQYKKDLKGNVTYFSSRYPNNYGITGHNIPQKNGHVTKLSLHYPTGEQIEVDSTMGEKAKEIIQQHAWEAHEGKSNNYALNHENFSDFGTDPQSWDLPITHPLAHFGEKI